MAKDDIYLDYAAATPLDKRVLKAMLPYLQEEFGNPSSLHGYGVRARRALEAARADVARVLASRPGEIVFTSGATESVNLAIHGVVRAAGGGHVVTAATEHAAVLEAVKVSGAEITYVPVDEHGRIRTQDVMSSVRPNTRLVTLMYANNETGVISPIADIGRAIMRYRAEHGTRYPYFHTDATQAAGTLSLNTEQLHVDLLTLSGGKMYGPKGSGVLFVRKDISLAPLVVGGRQEHALRAGTENVANAVGLAEAFKIADAARESESVRLTKLRDRFLRGLLKAIPESTVNGDRVNRLPNNVNFAIPGIDGEELVIRLDAKGIAASTASSCKGGGEMSHVLRAMGKSDESIRGSVRLTLGRQTKSRHIAEALRIIPEVVASMRS